MKKNSKKFKGFSIVEVLISLFVLTIGITVIAKLLFTAHKNSIESRNIIIASQLAQEGYELVRNFRDNNIAMSKPAFEGLATDSTYSCPRLGVSVSGINVGYSTSALMLCPNGNNVIYFQDGNEGIAYTYQTTSIQTPFKRKVTIVNTANNEIKIVRSVVTWGSKTIEDIETGGVENLCNFGNKCMYSESEITSRGWR